MIGQTLSHFQVTAKLGEGGMGEVYRATDTKLGREVAIKVLPANFVEDKERLARFEREAKVLASLNHPHIAAIYSLEMVSTNLVGTEEETEEPSAIHFLVMELAEGEDLAQRLTAGSIPVVESLKLARQIAEALQAAHAQGVVHRDLKPANIQVSPDHKVKVLDFGLAKAWDLAATSDLTRSPTLTAQMTQAGVILGTASYMSPEQARGQEVDKRSDIWSFGALLFEMLAGTHAFPGDTVTDILGAIVHKEPDWQRLPADFPAGIHRLLRRCLEKDIDRRLQDIGDARIEIDEALATGPEIGPVVQSEEKRRPLTWLSWAIGAAALAVAGWALFGRTAPKPTPTSPASVDRLTLVLPATQRLSYDGQSIAVSPDGRTVAYCARTGLGTQVHVRRRSRLEPVVFEGTDGCGSVFFSPDGESIGIVGDNEVSRVPVTGGAPVRISTGGTFSVGATWGDDDSIIFVRDWGSGLSRVTASGGEPEELTTPDTEAGEGAHLWPTMLPGSRTVLYTVWTSDQGGQTSIHALDIESRQSRRVLENARTPRYSETGHLLFMRGEQLMVTTFDPDRVEDPGAPTPLATGIRLYSNTYGAVFDVSDEGTLLYQAGGRWEQRRRIVWVDREGQVVPAIEDERDFTDPEISPDGRRILVTVRGAVFTVWIYDLKAGTRRKLLLGGDSGGAVWLPTGEAIVYWSNQDGPYALYRRSVDESSTPEQVTSTPTGDVDDIAVSPDGRFAIFRSRFEDAEKALVYVDLVEGGEARVFQRGRDNRANPGFSPDGRWLAFVSDESGQPEVHVAAFPGPGPNWVISTGGGNLPMWSRDGRELYYVRGDTVLAVEIELGEQFQVGKTEVLFESDRLIDDYSVTVDGRFLMLDRSEAEGPERHQLEIVLHWPSLLSP